MTETVSESVDEKLAQELAGGKSVKQAAEAVGLSDRTVYRRMLAPAFQQRMREIRRAVTSRVVNLLSRAAVDAAEVLHLLATSSEDEGTRLKASAALLDHLLRYQQQFDLEVRIARLEALSGTALDPLPSEPKPATPTDPVPLGDEPKD